MPPPPLMFEPVLEKESFDKVVKPRRLEKMILEGNTIKMTVMVVGAIVSKHVKIKRLFITIRPGI